VNLEAKQAWMRERQSSAQCPANGLTEDGKGTAFEPHCRPKDLAKLWGLNETTVRRLFQDQPGVLKIGRAGHRDGKRDYTSIRIPESIALRVHEERSR
jgi:hypothetical protein